MKLNFVPRNHPASNREPNWISPSNFTNQCKNHSCMTWYSQQLAKPEKRPCQLRHFGRYHRTPYHMREMANTNQTCIFGTRCNFRCKAMLDTLLQPKSTQIQLPHKPKYEEPNKETTEQTERETITQ